MTSINSYGETLVCSDVRDGEVSISTYTREGDIFMGGGDYGSASRIAFEGDYYLALITNIGLEYTWLFHYNKLSKEFKSIMFNVSSDNRITEGKCESIP